MWPYLIPRGIIGCTNIQHDRLSFPSHDCVHANARVSGCWILIGIYMYTYIYHSSVLAKIFDIKVFNVIIKQKSKKLEPSKFSSYLCGIIINSLCTSLHKVMYAVHISYRNKGNNNNQEFYSHKCTTMMLKVFTSKCRCYKGNCSK